MKKQKIIWFCSLFCLNAMLLAQNLEGIPDEDLPIAPLRAEDAPPPPPTPPPPPAELSLPVPSPMRVTHNDIAKVMPTKCVRPKGKFPWNLEKAKLTDLVDQISRLTCRNFIIASNVKPAQDISIISRTPITVDQAWQAFQSTLEANELSLFKTGDYYKIIKRSESTRQPIAVIDEKGTLPNDENMVTFLYDLKYLSKDVGQSLVKGLISRIGEVLIVGETFLVITDGSSNIRRVMNILSKVDVSGAANRIHIVDLVHADAVQIQQKLNDIFTGKSGTSTANRSPYDDFGPPPRRGASPENFSLQKMIADERTNKLIIISSDKAFDQIKEMIDVLDVPSSGASSKGEIYVYHLKNGDARKISTTLSTLLQGLKSGRSSSQPGGPFGREELFEGEIKINADEATNSLVIVASPRDYKSVIKVIAKLDKRRAQVYVEAAIMEVALEDKNTFDLGAFAGIPLPGGNTGILATPGGKTLASDMFKNIAQSLSSGGQQSTAAAAGLAPFLSTLGFLGAPQNLTLNGQNVPVPGIGAILNLVQSYSNADILATPSLMTLNNEKAEMSVGESIPTLSGISPGGLGGAGGLLPMQNITRQEPKLKFSVIPHVNDDNLIRLEIEQDVSDLGRSIAVVQGQPEQPTFNTKTTKTTVSAQDQQTIVLGGLISDKYFTTEEKVPWLGDIPLLGHLFKKTVKQKRKTNLLLVLTPYAVRDDNDLRKIYERKNKEREDFSKMYFGDRITKFDPYVDYDKKKGPLGFMIEQVRFEMQKTENGGPGLPGETVITPPEDHDDLEKHKVETLGISLPVQGGAKSEEGPMAMQPTETVIIDQPVQQVPEPAPVLVRP